MQPVLDENRPVAVGDEPNGLGRAGSANFHSDSGDDASHSQHAYGISLHGDTVSGGPPEPGPAGCHTSEVLLLPFDASSLLMLKPQKLLDKQEFQIL
jgi:hypothetical protein